MTQLVEDPIEGLQAAFEDSSLEEIWSESNAEAQEQTVSGVRFERVETDNTDQE